MAIALLGSMNILKQHLMKSLKGLFLSCLAMSLLGTPAFAQDKYPEDIGPNLIKRRIQFGEKAPLYSYGEKCPGTAPKKPKPAAKSELQKKIEKKIFSELSSNKPEFCKKYMARDQLNLQCYENRVCKDGTRSAVQPRDVTSIWDNFDYEGQCGPTAAANVVGMMCGTNISPDTAARFGNDITPGWKPSTLKNAMNRLLTASTTGWNAALGMPLDPIEHLPARCPKGRFKVLVSKTKEEHLQALKDSVFPNIKKPERLRNAHQMKVDRSPWTTRQINLSNIRQGLTEFREIVPTAALTFITGMNVHWVTVVDILKDDQDPMGCQIVYNDDRAQTKIGCGEFLKKSSTLKDFSGYYLLQFVDET